MATNSLASLYRPQRHGSGIDFMAFARGAAAGRDANWIDEVRANKRIEMDAKRGETLRQIQDREWDREAQRFTSTMMRNRQFAADAGVSPTDYLITQREQLLEDPNFRYMQPEVQQRILNQIGMAARTHMEELTNTGRLQDALRVGQAFGMTPSPTEVHAAGQTGESARILDSVNRRFGTNYAVDDEGFVDVNGINIPLNLVVQHVQTTGDAANLPALAAQWQAQELEREAQAAAEAETMSIVNALEGGGAAQGPTVASIDPETGLPTGPLSGSTGEGTSSSPAPVIPGPLPGGVQSVNQILSNLALGDSPSGVAESGENLRQLSQLAEAIRASQAEPLVGQTESGSESRKVLRAIQLLLLGLYNGS